MCPWQISRGVCRSLDYNNNRDIMTGLPASTLAPSWHLTKTPIKLGHRILGHRHIFPNCFSVNSLHRDMLLRRPISSKYVYRKQGCCVRPISSKYVYRKTGLLRAACLIRHVNCRSKRSLCKVMRPWESSEEGMEYNPPATQGTVGMRSHNPWFPELSWA